MGGLGLPRQPAHQQTTLANQTMRDVVAVSPGSARERVCGSARGRAGRLRSYECCVNTHLRDGANTDTVDEGALQNLSFLQRQHTAVKMEAEGRTRQPREITGKFEQLFPILSMWHHSLRHLTTMIVPQIIKSLSESQPANTCLCSLPWVPLETTRSSQREI